MVNLIDSETLQKYTVVYFLKDRSFFLKAASYLKTSNYKKKSYFKDSKLQFVVNFLCMFRDKFSRFPTKADFYIFIERLPETDEYKKLLKNTIDDLFSADLSQATPEYVKESTYNTIKLNRAYEATMENQADISNKNYDNLVDRMAKAVNVNFDKDLGVSITDLKGNIEMIKEVQDDSNGISFGSEMLDRAIGNKAMPGELVVFCGVPGAGKTLWLGNVATNAFRNNKKVAIFSLEVSKRRLVTRIYQSLFFKSKQEILEVKPEDISPYMESCPNGDIRILNFQANSASCNDFAATLNDLRVYENWEPDAIIIDYTLITSANDKTASKDDKYGYFKTVSEEMRNLGVQFNCPVFTAAQINREGMGDKGGSKGVLTSKDISESRGIVDTADYVLIIQQTAAEKLTDKQKNEGKYRIFVDKNRNGGNFQEVKFIVNWTNLTLQEAHEENKP